LDIAENNYVDMLGRSSV